MGAGVFADKVEGDAGRGRTAIGTIAGHRIEDVDDGHHFGPGMHFVAGDADGVSRAVDALVMLIDDHQLAEREIGTILQLDVAAERMRFDDFSLGRIETARLGENAGGDKPFADVVQHSGDGDLLQLLAIGDAHALGKDHAVTRDVGDVGERLEVVAGNAEQLIWQHVAGLEQIDDVAADLFREAKHICRSR